MRILANKKAYDSDDVDVFINGIPVNVTEITYDTEQEHQVNFGLKKKATSYSVGKETHTGTIGLLMQDVVQLEKAANGNLLAIKPFPINVTYVNDDNMIVNDTIIAKFAKTGREVTGDMGLQKQYELLVLDIDYNNLL